MDIELVVNNQNNCIINGIFSRSYIVKIIKLGDRFIQQAEEPCFDLKGVTGCDSAGVALLVHWWQVAKKLDKKIYFHNLPDEMKAIINICHVEMIIS